MSNLNIDDLKNWVNKKEENYNKDYPLADTNDQEDIYYESGFHSGFYECLDKLKRYIDTQIRIQQTTKKRSLK
jgi:hypothetical protein